MTEHEWQANVETKLRALATTARKVTSGLLYGALSSATIFPLVERFDALRVVQTVMSEADKDWFAQTMRAALKEVGSRLTIGGAYIQVGNLTNNTGVAIGRQITQIINYYHPATQNGAPAVDEALLQEQIRTYLHRRQTNQPRTLAAFIADYWQRFPTSAMTVSLGDFAFFRVTPRRGRFVADFGQIFNLTKESLQAAAASSDWA